MDAWPWYSVVSRLHHHESLKLGSGRIKRARVEKGIPEDTVLFSVGPGGASAGKEFGGLAIWGNLLVLSNLIFD